MALGLYHPCPVGGRSPVAVHDGCKLAAHVTRDPNLEVQVRRSKEVLIVHPQGSASWDFETRESHGLQVFLQESLCTPMCAQLSASRDALFVSSINNAIYGYQFTTNVK